jgi:hypothetical protein
VLAFNPKKEKEQMTELTEFCRRVTALQENEDEYWYLRIRIGRNRKTSETIASGIECTGLQPLTLERMLEERIRSAGGEAPVWIEAIQKGTSMVRDTVKLPAYEEEHIESSGAGHTEAALVQMAQCVVDALKTEQRRGERNFQMMMEAQAQAMISFKETVYLAASSNDDGESEMSKALAMIAPAVAGMLTTRQASESRQPTEETPEDLGAVADELVEAVVHLAETNPGVITPERLSRLATVLR